MKQLVFLCLDVKHMDLTHKKLIIAIDGFSSCGKSTFARDISKELGYLYIDSGAMYRAVTLYAFREGIIRDNNIDKNRLIGELDAIEISFERNGRSGKADTFLNGENVEDEIRGVAVSEMVSPVSKIREVRKKMVSLQREFAKNKGVVMDGRDIGTVVFPDADIKIFMTASPEIRAKRRYDELTEKGLTVSLKEIMHNIASRDLQDSTREESPLKKAENAIELDNSHMTPAEQMQWFRMLLEKW